MSTGLEFVDLSGFKIAVDTTRYSPVMVSALKSGDYESGERTLVKRIFNSDDKVLEVGSSIGAVSLCIASIVGTSNFIGFEANPELMPDAIANFRNNGLTLTYHNALLRNRVRGGAGEPADFYINKDFWISSLTKTTDTIRTVKVPVFCLEDEIIKFGANCLMLDIEGAEAELLLYADLSSIEKIFMELHYWPSEPAAHKMVRYLISEGFDLDVPNCFGHNLSFRRNSARA